MRYIISNYIFQIVGYRKVAIPRLVYLLVFFYAAYFGYIPIFAQHKVDFNYPKIIKFNVLESFYTLTFPTLQFAYEQRLRPNLTIIPELGFQVFNFPKFYMLGPRENTFVTPHGIKALIELRYYFNNNKFKKSPGHSAIGINFYYRYNADNAGLTYFPNKDTSISIDDYFSYQKQVIGSKIVLSYQVIRPRWLSLEFFASAGTHYCLVKNNELDYKSGVDELYRNQHAFYPNPFLKENDGWQLSLNAGFKIGYTFKKK